MAEAPAESNFSSILGAKGSTTCKYFKKKLIGTGSYGEAWLVERASDQAHYVAKIMDLGKMSARDKQYAYSEIKCLASCDHPNIIRFAEDHEENDQLLIVMEFADSGDLDRQIKARAADNFRYFQEHEALFLFIQLCLAVDHIHRHKMLHRDIKGANVLLTSTGLIKLGDFGFSHQYEGTVSGSVAQTFCGTPYYLAPELWNNQRYSKKADVWSVGVLLYEIMALKRPFTASNMKALMAKVLAGDYPPLPEKFSADFRNVAKLLLVVDPDKRPSIREMFEHPYVREGMKVFMDTVKKSARIPVPLKEEITTHCGALFSSTTPTTPRLAAVRGSAGVLNRDVSFRGPVRKLGGVSGTTWKDRYLILRRGQLIICEREGDESTGKALNLEQVQSVCPVPPSTAKRYYVFSINTTRGKSTWIQGANREDMEGWIDAIQQALGEA